MANYEGTTRTNYFKVKDVEAFKSLIKRTYGTPEPLDIFEKKDAQTGETLYGFGCYGSIEGIDDQCTDGYAEPDFGAFVDELQKLISEGDAVIIMESGNEKLRYVTGYATVITSTKVEYIDMSTNAKNVAKKLLNNENWTTRMEY